MSTPFRQLKASAGSGKTYALTLRFLDLLAGAAEDDPGYGYACAADAAGSPGRRYAWPEILAITFTNKAAAEMRERVLGALKRRAMGETSGPGDGLDAAKAQRLLMDILRHTESLGVRTIDSLLSLLVRLFALDEGLAPEFDTVFDEQKAIGDLFDRFLARCADEPDGREAALYEQAVRTMIEHEDKDGFWLQEALRDRFIELSRLLLTARSAPGATLTTDQNQIADLLAVSFDAMRSARDELARILDDEDLTGQANFSKLLDKCADAELFGGLPDSAYLRKPTLAECLLAKCRGHCASPAEAAYDEFKSACAEYVHAHAVLNAAYALAPSVEIGLALLRGLDDAQRRQGFLLGSQMAGIVDDALGGGAGVPDAFCRLGDRLHHLLVDEFQDTSRAQWSATLPLAAECLAKGGSLFYVGDVKQAIYGWRGGDAKLFDEVGEDAELTAMSGGLTRESLPNNWRSAPEIVRFNNAVFGRLGDDEVLRDLASVLLAGAPDDVTNDFASRMTASFADCAQAVPESRMERHGRVLVRLLPMGKTDEVVEASLDALVQTIKEDILPRRRLGDVAVLVRTGTHSDLVCERLVAEGLPIITENSLLLARHPVVRQLTALLRLLDAPPDDVSFLTFACGRELFLTESGLMRTQILEWAVRTKERRGDRHGGRRGGLLSHFRDDFPEIHARLLAPFLRQTGLMRPYDLVQAALRTYQVLERHPEAELYARRFLEVIHLAESAGMGSLPRFLEFWDESGAEEKVPLPESADAVRILTIHKSKGLQFPVCIVPFHNWSAGPKAEFGVVETSGRRVLTRVTKAVGRRYYENAADNLAEQANLLYVAWTRAEEELYVFVPDARDNQRLGAAPVMLGRLLNIPPEEAGLELGEAPACAWPEACGTTSVDAAAARDVPPRTEAPDFRSWLPRLRVFRHAVEDAGFDERTRGKVAHKAVELLSAPTGDDASDASRAARLALGEFPELRALARKRRDELQAQVEQMLLWLLARPEARPHLGHAGSELTVLADDGAFLRPDLLRFTQTGPVVLEFKTGRAAPEHARQLRTYLRLARDITRGRGQADEPRGYLVYLDRRVIEPVGLANRETTGHDGPTPKGGAA